MKSNLTKFALSASIMLAMAFTFSCSSDDENNDNGGGSSGGTSSPSGGGGVPFNENSQVYKKDGTAYTGSGVIKIRTNCISDDDGNMSETLINAGNVTGGIVSLQLPQTIPDDYLGTIYSEAKQQSNGCTEYPAGLKGLRDACSKDLIALVNSNLSADYINSTSTADYIGKLRIQDKGEDDSQAGQTFQYWYFSKAGKITCSVTKSSGKVDKVNINATPGWNKIYFVHNENGMETSTNNILTKEMKWYIY